MKKILFILFILSSLAVESATVKVDTRNFTSEPTIRRRTTLTLIEQGPVVAGPWLVAGDSVAKFTDTNGVAYYSNVLAGAYRLDVAGTPGRSYPITVMDTNVLLNAADLVNTTNLNTSFYTAAQVDALIAIGAGGLTNNQVLPGIPTTTNARFSGNFSGALTGRVWVTGANVPWSIAAYDGGGDQFLAFMPSSNLLTGIFFKDNGNIELTGDIWTTGKFIGDGTAIGGTLTNNTTGNASTATTASGLDATGITQARNRVHTNLFVTPQMFGATGDGSTDDTGALRQWLWFAGTNNVVAKLPPAPGGYYKITDTLVITNSVTIIGTGGQRHNPGVAATKSQIRQFGVGKSAIIATNYAAGYGSLHDNIEIRDLAITCDSSAYTYADQFGIGFLGDASDQDNVLCQNLLVSGFGKGVGIVGMSASVFLNMDIADNGDNVYIGPYGENTATVINTILFSGGSCSHSYTNNWKVIGAHQLTIDTMDNATTSGRSQRGYDIDSSRVIIRNVNVESSTAGKPFGIANNNSLVILEAGLAQLYVSADANTYEFVTTNSTVILRNHASSHATSTGFKYLNSSSADNQGFLGDPGVAFRNHVGGSTLWTNYVNENISTVFPSLMGTPTPTLPHQWQITDRVGGQANSTLYFTARFYSLLGNANVVAVDLLDWYKSKISTATVASFIATNTITATNGYLRIENATFPTNAIPLGTSTKTNTASIVYKGIPMTVATNRAVGGWMRWRTTDETWQPYTP